MAKKDQLPTEPLKVENFEMMSIWRSQVIPAPYNPRLITDEAKKALSHSIKTFGLIEPLIWNKRNSTLVGGHQRLNELDKLFSYHYDLDFSDEKNPKQIHHNDYRLTVAAVDMDEKQELEANMALNNPSSMGSFDFNKIAHFEGFDPKNAGFGKQDVDFFSQIRFENQISNKSADEIVDIFQEMKDEAKAAQPPSEAALNKAIVSDIKANAQAKVKEPTVYVTIILASQADKNILCEHFGKPSGDYLMGEDIFHKLRIGEFADRDDTPEEQQHWEQEQREQNDE